VDQKASHECEELVSALQGGHKFHQVNRRPDQPYTKS